jgi:hypothetical protein
MPAKSSPIVLVRALLRAQFPHWADLSITALPSAEAGRALYRIGDDLAARRCGCMAVCTRGCRRAAVPASQAIFPLI